MGGKGDRDGAGAGTDVDDLQGLVCGQEFEDGFDEVFGFGARDEDGGSDFECEAVELLLPGDVLDGFVAQTAGDAVFVCSALVGAECAAGVGNEGGAGDLQGVKEEEFGVAGGGVAEVLVGVELCGGNGES